MKYNSRIISIIRSTLFAVLGVLFLHAAGDMEPGSGQTIFYIFGVLNIIWAGWILFSYLRSKKR